MAAHTSGPWKVDLRDGIFKYDIVGPHGEDIAYCNASDGTDEPTMYPVDANAHLIAAAPDMLEALQEYLEWGAMTGSDRDLFEDKFRAAIAKAEGR